MLFRSCAEVYNPAFQGRRDGVAPFNRGEVDFPEAYLHGNFSGHGGQEYNATLLGNTGNTGPTKDPTGIGFGSGLTQPHADPAVYNVPVSPLGANLWKRPITWGFLWLTDTVTITRDNIPIMTRPTPPYWSNPLLPTGQPSSMWFQAHVRVDPYFNGARPANYTITNEIIFVRVWQP